MLGLHEINFRREESGKSMGLSASTRQRPFLTKGLLLLCKSQDDPYSYYDYRAYYGYPY